MDDARKQDLKNIARNVLQLLEGLTQEEVQYAMSMAERTAIKLLQVNPNADGVHQLMDELDKEIKEDAKSDLYQDLFDKLKQPYKQPFTPWNPMPYPTVTFTCNTYGTDEKAIGAKLMDRIKALPLTHV